MIPTPKDTITDKPLNHRYDMLYNSAMGALQRSKPRKGKKCYGGNRKYYAITCLTHAYSRVKKVNKLLVTPSTAIVSMRAWAVDTKIESERHSRPKGPRFVWSAVETMTQLKKRGARGTRMHL